MFKKDCIHFDELFKHDVEILKFIDSNISANIVDLTDKFGMHSQYRIDRLLSQDYILNYQSKLSNSDPDRHLGMYLISDKGKSVLEDYKYFKKEQKKQFLQKSVYVPLIITLITNAISIVLQWLLLY